MHYDPIKEKLGSFFNRAPWLRRLFYRLLDLLLLRTWHVHKDLRAWMKQYPHGADIFDAGMGFGQYSYWMARQNHQHRILAVDVKEEQVEDCRRFFKQEGLHNVEFQIQDLVTYQRPNSFDLILSVDVMEHIEQDVEVFKNFHASLKNNGMLLVNTPSDQGGSDVTEEGESSFISEHVRDGYNIVEIEDKLRLAGFSRVEARYAYGKPGSLAWRLSMKMPMKMLNRSMAALLVLPFYYAATFPLTLVLNYIDVQNRHHKGTGLVVKAWK